MTEDEARMWIADWFGEEPCGRVGDFLAMVVDENGRQNLISPGTIETIWSRHAVDSAQLLRLAPDAWEHWIDIGTGGGFPGMIVAILKPERQVTMVEPRRRRADFLARSLRVLGLDRAKSICAKIEQVDLEGDVLSARAVAKPYELLQSAKRCASARTRWILPRGRSPIEPAISGVFHVEHSITDPLSTILTFTGRPQ